VNKDKVKAFADKVYGDTAGAMAVGMAYVGVKTGLFRAMEGKDPFVQRTSSGPPDCNYAISRSG
jgi:hypothetical protein